MLQNQADCEAEKSRLHSKISELSVALDRCKSHLEEKDQTISDLKSSKPLVSVNYL